jgi:preprotein translocase subunit YajC
VTGLVLLAVGFLFLWLFVVLPSRRSQRTKLAMQDTIEPGDEIVTAGGLYGTVLDVGEDDLEVEIAPEIVVRIAKRAVAARFDEDDEEDDAEEFEAGEDDEPDPAGELEPHAEAKPTGEHAS